MTSHISRLWGLELVQSVLGLIIYKLVFRHAFTHSSGG